MKIDILIKELEDCFLENAKGIYISDDADVTRDGPNVKFSDMTAEFLIEVFYFKPGSQKDRLFEDLVDTRKIFIKCENLSLASRFDDKRKELLLGLEHDIACAKQQLQQK